MPFLLSDAREVARGLVETLAPACTRIEIAGSIRRRVGVVKDIELVALPRWAEVEERGEQGGLFGPSTRRENLLTGRLMDCAWLAGKNFQVIKPGTREIIPWQARADARYIRLFLRECGTEGMKVDLFIPSPEAWGLILAIRTGSGVGPDGRSDHGFAPALLSRWKQMSGGGRSVGGCLVRPGGSIEPTPEEGDVFRALQMDFVPPEERRSSADAERAFYPPRRLR